MGDRARGALRDHSAADWTTKRPTTRGARPTEQAPPQGAIWPQVGTGRTLTQRVYELVRDRIIAGQVAPLSFLREEEVARAMGVSRTPVREALNRLASEAFLERLPHRGYRVPERSIDELVHVYVVLQGLELLAAELAFPRMTAADLDQLERINVGFGEALAANDVATAVDLNDRFHHLLSESSGNPVLCGLLDDLRAQVHRLEVLDYTWVLLEGGVEGGGTIPRDVWVKQHAAILDGVRRRDFAAARELLRENRSFVLRAKVEQAKGAAAPDGSGMGSSAPNDLGATGPPS